MKLKPFLILAICTMALSSCMKPIINPDGSLNIDKNTGGDGGSTPLSNADTYQPVTKGSTWTYAVALSGQNYSTTGTMTGDRTIFNGKTYYNIAATATLQGAASGTSYFYSSQHVYANRGTSIVANVTVEMPYLIDTVAVGHTWKAQVNDSGVINGTQGRFVGTMVERNIAKTVAGKSYSNVMHTQIDLQYNVQGTFQSFGTYDYYIAKGVGVIELDASAFGMTISNEVLTSYSIK
ncbi:hypothetical protein ABZR88_09915 [Mucilaginibacter yixingensis]|nr:hypothetical protein [Mucilaginibacter yixingensis]